MSTDPHAADVPEHAGAVAHHATDDHGEDAHGEEPLGPIDIKAWGAAILGVALGAVTAACFVVATTRV